MLLRDREATPGVEPPPPVSGQDAIRSFPCEACGAGMRADQDWCLECGTAAPGRLGTRPGWRAAFTVVGLTLLLVVGAVAASYAALTSDAERDAARPSAGPGNPIVAQTPGAGPPAAPVSPGATGPGTTAPPVKVVPTPRPALPAVKVPQASPSSGGRSSAKVGASTGTAHDTNGSSSASTTSGASTATATAVKIASAATYDPNKRPGAEFGPAANAIDGSDASVWDVTTPADDKPLGVGLVLDLGAAYKLHSLTISTSTQGFRVELYGAKSKQIPPDILDARWEHLIDRSAYADGSTVSLAGTSKSKLRYINLWFTSPRDIKDPRIAIRDVTVSATK